MLNSIVRFCSPGRLNCLKIPLAGLLLMNASFSAGEAKAVTTNEFYTPASLGIVGQPKTVGKDLAVSTLKDKLPERDGIYLYGQSSEPARIGQEYVVFELRQDKVVGAFYLPQSEFSCFEGTLRSGKLSLTIASNPDSDADPSPVASQPSQVATASGRLPIGTGPNPIAYSYSVALQNYHKLASVSTSDQQILRTCKNNQL